jgi:hypothetical protein
MSHRLAIHSGAIFVLARHGSGTDGGLVVSFYGATDQVDRYLPAAAAAARTALAGTVSGV